LPVKNRLVLNGIESKDRHVHTHRTGSVHAFSGGIPFKRMLAYRIPILELPMKTTICLDTLLKGRAPKASLN
jgi:hypothetical protein